MLGFNLTFIGCDLCVERHARQRSVCARHNNTLHDGVEKLRRQRQGRLSLQKDLREV